MVEITFKQYILNSSNSLFNENHSLAIRIWHWTFFAVILSSLVTVLFASTLFKTRPNIPMVQAQIEENGGTVTHDQAKAVAHEYNDKLWDLHTWIGYGLCFLLFSRIIIEVSNSKEEKLKNKIKKALAISNMDLVEKNDKRHYLLAKYGYLFFYIIILIMAITGLGLAFEDVPFLKEIHRNIKQVHSFFQYLAYFYMLSHLIGVIRADITKNKGIVSQMINGKKL